MLSNGAPKQKRNWKLHSLASILIWTAASRRYPTPLSILSKIFLTFRFTAPLVPPRLHVSKIIKGGFHQQG